MEKTDAIRNGSASVSDPPIEEMEGKRPVGAIEEEGGNIGGAGGLAGGRVEGGALLARPMVLIPPTPVFIPPVPAPAPLTGDAPLDEIVGSGFW